MLVAQRCPDFAGPYRRRLASFNHGMETWTPADPGSPVTRHPGPQADQLDTIEYLMQLDTLSSLGQMAAGIVHEIRNPLASVRGFLQMLFMEWTGSENGREYIDIMLNEIDTINQIASELLHLSRPDSPGRELCSLDEIIKEIAGLIKGQALLQGVQVCCCLVPGVMPQTMADRKQLKQVLLNLATNAIQAMPDGGVLRITTTYLQAARGYLIEVADNGSGIDPQVIPRIFTPFYSTKPQGGGLGLCVVNRIVQEHGGHIKVESQVGKGTVFRIWLPRVTGDELS